MSKYCLQNWWHSVLTVLTFFQWATTTPASEVNMYFGVKGSYIVLHGEMCVSIGLLCRFESFWPASVIALWLKAGPPWARQRKGGIMNARVNGHILCLLSLSHTQTHVFGLHILAHTNTIHASWLNTMDTSPKSLLYRHMTKPGLETHRWSDSFTNTHFMVLF